MAFPDELTRHYSVKTRILIGPPFRKSSDAYFWDWSALSVGSDYTPLAATTLASSINSASASISLASGSYPAKGGCWIGPNGTNEHWEYIEWSSGGGTSLSGLAREATGDEQSGTHTAGAAVRFWWILEDDGTLDVEETLTGNLSASEISGSLAGVNFPLKALANYHLILVQQAWANASNVFGNWQNALVGWSMEPKVVDEGTRTARWSASIGGLNEMLSVIPCLGLRVGPPNLALTSNATADPSLGKWYKEIQSAEFVSSAADFAPNSAIDEDIDTLYMSETFIGSDNCIEDSNAGHDDYQYPDLDGAMVGIDQIHVSPYRGQGNGYRWIQVHIKPGKGVWPQIANGDGVYPVVIKDQFIISQPRIIFVENMQCFSDENPVISVTNGDEPGTQVIEINGSQFGVSSGGGSINDWWDSFAPAGGSVSFSGGTVSWGTAGGLNALLPGQTIRRIWSGANAGTYEVSYISMPGYAMHQWMTRQHYFLCELQGLGLTLANDITNVSPGTGDELYINSGSTPCTNGLYATGTLCIGAEYITYSAKSTGSVTVLARGASLSSAAAHKAGDTIYVLENGAVTDGWPIISATWKRKVGLPTLKRFWMFGARWPIKPRILGNGYWMYDYDLWVSGDIVNNNTESTYTYTHEGANKRYRWVLIVGERMATDPYRFCLNEVEVIADSTVYGEHQYIAAASVFAIAREILLGCGIPDAAIIDGGSTPVISNFTTSTENAWSVLVDLMDMSNCFLEIGRDGKITVSNHPFWSLVPSQIPELGRGEIIRFEYDAVRGRSVGQVELKWDALDKSSKGTVRYPTPRDPYGDVQQIGPWRYANAAAALASAQKLYWQARRPHAATMQLDGAAWYLRPGLMRVANWDFEDGDTLYKREHIIQSVAHRFEGLGMETVIRVMQTSREDEI